MKIISSMQLTLAEVKEILDARKKEGEFGYEQKQAYEYAEYFAKQNKKEAKKSVESLISENKKITRETAVTLVNIAPTSPKIIKMIALKNKIELSDEEVEKILKIIHK